MILVTGGAGYIGSALVKKLIEKKKEVVVIDDLSQGEKEYVHPQALFYQFNILEKAKLNQVFTKYPIDVVFHLAAKKAVEESESQPFLYIKNNIVGTIILLETMLKNNCSKIIFSSTACVYQENTHPHMVYQENHLIKTYNFYGFTKLENENLIQELGRINKLNYVIFRYFNVCGDYGLNYQENKTKNIFPVLAKAIKQDYPFQVFGNDYPTTDGSGIRDYIHLQDLIIAHHLGLTINENKIYNLGTNTGTSVLEIIKEFEKQLQKKVKYQITSRRDGDVAISLASYQKAKQELGWEAKKKIATMVKDYIRIFKLNENNNH